MLVKNCLITSRSESGGEQSKDATCRGNRTDSEMKEPGSSQRQNPQPRQDRQQRQNDSVSSEVRKGGASTKSKANGNMKVLQLPQKDHTHLLVKEVIETLSYFWTEVKRLFYNHNSQQYFSHYLRTFEHQLVYKYDIIMLSFHNNPGGSILRHFTQNDFEVQKRVLSKMAQW